MTFDPIDRVIAECQDDIHHQRDALFDQACRDHPEHAQQIRDRLGQRASARSPQQAPNDDAQHVGPYRLLNELGRGGQAVVYLAEDTRLHRHVALKILKGFGPLSENVIERFRREAEVTSKLDHPGICAVYDTGVENGVPYIAMRLVHGTTLAARISEAKGSDEEFEVLVEDGPPRTKPAGVPNLRAAQVGVGAVQSGLTTTHQEVLAIVEVIEKAARALHAAHEAGVIHRDIKPGNIMVSPDGQPIILDFGLASDEEGDFRTLTQSGDLFGTPAYMSPEQLMAQRVRLDRRTDVYSLGVTLFECLALRQPFEAPTREGMYQAIQYKDPPDVRKLNPRIPRDLKVVIETALQKDRDKRYATAAAFAEDLRRVRVSEPITAKPVGPIGRIARFAKRRPAMAALIGVLILALPTIAGLGGFLAANWKEIKKEKQRAIDDEIERDLEAGYFDLVDGAPARAISDFDAGLVLKSTSAEAIAGKVMALLRLNRAEDAMRILDQQAPSAGTDDALHLLRGDVLEKIDRKAEAEALRSRLTRPTTPLGLFLAGQRDCERGDASGRRDLDAYRTAVDALSDGIARAPAARLLYYGALARAAAGAKDITLVRRIVAALIVLWPESGRASFDAGYALSEMGEWSDAATAYRRAIALGANQMKVHCNLGNALTRIGKFDEAIIEFDIALVIDHDSAIVHDSKGNALRGKGRFEEAMAEFKRASDLDENFASPHVNMGFEFYRRKEPDKAIAQFDLAIKLDPTDSMAHTSRGNARQDKGDFDGAMSDYTTAIAIDPTGVMVNTNLGMTHTNLGNVLRAKRQLDDAIGEYREGVRINPNEPLAHYDLGLALQDKGLIDEAIDEYRIAINLDDKDAPNHNNLGWALNVRGQFREALLEFTKAVALDENNVTARKNLDHVNNDLLRYENTLDRIVGGGAWTDEPDELVMVALVASGRDLHALAAKMWLAVFTEQPGLTEGSRHWLDRAARSAVIAAAGAGKDGAALDQRTRVELRTHSREWLASEMATWAHHVAEDGSKEIREHARWVLERWKSDPKLASVREPAEIAKLPESERPAWVKLWEDIDTRLKEWAR